MQGDGLNRKFVQNHDLARKFPQDVSKYLNKEISLDAMLGP